MGLDPITPGSRPEPKADALTAVPPRRPKQPTLDFTSGPDLRGERVLGLSPMTGSTLSGESA